MEPADIVIGCVYVDVATRTEYNRLARAAYERYYDVEASSDVYFVSLCDLHAGHAESHCIAPRHLHAGLITADMLTPLEKKEFWLNAPQHGAIDAEHKCWPWQGNRFGGRSHGCWHGGVCAWRLAYVLGGNQPELRDGDIVRHTCNFRALRVGGRNNGGCVNPAHLIVERAQSDE